jgi:ribosomal protein L40E
MQGFIGCHFWSAHGRVGWDMLFLTMIYSTFDQRPSHWTVWAAHPAVWFGLAVIFLAVDYFTGAAIPFSIAFIFSVALAAWPRGVSLGLVFRREPAGGALRLHFSRCAITHVSVGHQPADSYRCALRVCLAGDADRPPKASPCRSRKGTPRLGRVPENPQRTKPVAIIGQLARIFHRWIEQRSSEGVR